MPTTLGSPEYVESSPLPGFNMPKRITSLDGIRGLAILSVIAFHTLRIKGDVSGVLVVWRALQESSWAGVDLFFVLSGFLITGILLDSKGDESYFKNFYARRTLRIMPLYYAVLVVVLLVVPAVLGLQRLPPIFTRLLSNQIWLWTYLQNYIQSTGAHALPGLGHFWSLAVEEQFYWFWPLLVYFLNRRYLFILCLAVCAGEPLLRLGMLHFGVTPWAIRQYTYTRADTLLYGGLAAVIIRSPVSAVWLRKNILIPVALSAAALSTIVLRNGFVPYEAAETLIVGYSAIGFLFAVCIYKAASEANRLGKVLSACPLRWFGKYSYAIYIFHWPVAQAYEAIVANRVAFLDRPVSALFCFVVVTSVSSGIAVLSWLLFESRFLSLKRYFEHSAQVRSSGRKPAAAPLAA